MAKKYSDKRRSRRAPSVIKKKKAAKSLRMAHVQGMEVAIGNIPMTASQEQDFAATIDLLLSAMTEKQRKG